MPPSPQRVLVVEDEPTIADILCDYLQQAGFAATRLGDGRQALDAIRSAPFDLIILDLMLPGLDGISLCREVRGFSNIPIIMVTALVEEVDRLLGLKVGADDYICKPFSPREVVARVAAVLRRAQPPRPQAIPVLELDEDAQRIAILGQRLDLTPTEYRLLKLLACHPGRIYSRAQILDLVYQADQDVSDRIIDSHIKNIRRKLSAIRPDMDPIHSVYGVGYRFELDPA